MPEERDLKTGWQWVKFGDVIRLSKARYSESGSITDEVSRA
jgi:hypothetical protein